jgi:hypothetical protein
MSFLAGNEHDQAWRQCGSTAWPEGGVPWCFPQLMDAMMRLRWLAGIIHKCPSFGHFVFYLHTNLTNEIITANRSVSKSEFTLA